MFGNVVVNDTRFEGDADVGDDPLRVIVGKPCVPSVGGPVGESTKDVALEDLVLLSSAAPDEVGRWLSVVGSNVLVDNAGTAECSAVVILDGAALERLDTGREVKFPGVG